VRRPAGRWFWDRVLAWWEGGGRRDFPWRNDADPFQILVAEMLLQRTRADAVRLVWPAVVERWPDARSLSSASEAELDAMTSTLGLRWRSRNLKRMANALVEEHCGEVPREGAALMRLPGVGPYVATATRVMAFEARDLVSDANVVRVFARLLGFQADAETRRRRWFAERIMPFEPMARSRESNLSLLDFAAGVCTPRQPSCHNCPLASRCRYAASTVTA
jgi:A/G-specific adenine glycosylase